MDHAAAALLAREELLDGLERRDCRVAADLLAGLGAPAAWLEDRPKRPAKPQWGASRLDGVLGNHTSDFIRGVLRRALPAASSVTADELRALWAAVKPPSATDGDKTGWSPRGTRVDLLHQWLAALGLSLLPVGLRAHGPSRTPCHWRVTGARGVTLPLLAAPTSVPRLRALLQLPGLVVPPPALGSQAPTVDAAVAGRLRALGIRELVSFPALDRSTPQSVAFSFGRATRIEL